MNYFCIYQHVRLDLNTPFYVGKGSGKRTYCKSSRNKYWKSIVKKFGYRVEILEDNLLECQALKKEMELIAKYKSLGYCEANITDGGGGITGLRHSLETKKRISEKTKGEKNPMYGRSRKGDFDGEKNGMYGKGHLISGENHPLFGKHHSEETKEKMRKAHKGLQSGKKHGMYGKTDIYNSKKVINIVTGAVYDSICQAARILNINNTTLGNYLSGKLKNKTDLRYLETK